MLYNILLIVQIVISLSIIGLVLIQHGKGADAGAAFGGGGAGASGSVFGSRGSGNFLSRTTAVLATLFFANCLALAWLVVHEPENTSMIEGSAVTSTVAPKSAPAATESKPAESTSAPAADSPANDIPDDTGSTAEQAPAPAQSGGTGSDIPE